MVKYLIFLSYIGSRYRGAAKQLGLSNVIDLDTIEGALETAFHNVIPRSRIYPKVEISSRTDAGVHALFNSAQVQLQHPDDCLYDTEYIIRRLNTWFAKCGHEIRITNVSPMSDEFDYRRSINSRTYIYRFLEAKDVNEHRVPIAELGRAWHLRGEKIDIEAFRNGMKLFLGRKNFATFSPRNRSHKQIKYERSLMDFSLEPGVPLMPKDPLSDLFNFWQVNITSRSFVYNQVRRLVGCLVALASGTITERDIKIMLHVPSYFNWDPRLIAAPAQGLFLKHIDYDKEILEKHKLLTEPLAQEVPAVQSINQ